MRNEFVFDQTPVLNKPVFVLGFGGWPNGGNVALGTAEFLIKELKASRFATVNADLFYRYDDGRPTVKVKGGQLEEVTTSEAALYAARQEETGVDIIIFKGDEPQLRWFAFVDALFSCCKQFHVSMIVSLGGLQDNVAHTETVISALATNEAILGRLSDLDIKGADYEGPGAIHSLILKQAKAMGIDSVSLWGHCPFYLQGTHLKLLCKMAEVLAELTGLELEVTDLEKGWALLAKQIQHFVDGNPELQNVIQELMESKAPRRSPGAFRKDGNVIYLDRFSKPEDSP
jgi:proteasome assembly chaperone (PAC2) family protein